MTCMSLFCMHFHVPLWCPSSLPTSQPAARLKAHHEAARNAVLKVALGTSAVASARSGILQRPGQHTSCMQLKFFVFEFVDGLVDA